MSCGGLTGVFVWVTTTTQRAPITTPIATSWAAVSASSRNNHAASDETTGMSRVIVDASQTGRRGMPQFMREWPTTPPTTMSAARGSQSSPVGGAMSCPAIRPTANAKRPTHHAVPVVNSCGVSLPAVRLATMK